MYGQWYEFWKWPTSLKYWVRGVYYTLRPKERTPADIVRANRYGLMLDQNAFTRAKRSSECNHLKGGYVTAKWEIPTHGDRLDDYAVTKHILSNGDYWIRCLRCGHTWTAPTRRDYPNDALYLQAVREYVRAIDFPTRNVTSGSLQFRFSDDGETYRRLVR